MARLRSWTRILPALAGLCFGLAIPRQAKAFEHQWHLGAEGGYSALVTGAGATLHGFGGGLRLTYGLSDTVNLIASGDVTVHPASKYKGLAVDGSLLAGGNLGFAYVIDILQVVPWVGATAGAYYAAGPTEGGMRLALGVPFGLDYQVSRRFAVGAAGEYKLLFMDPAGTAQRISGFVRAEYIWGF